MRQLLRAAPEVAGWPRVRAGRLVVGPDEVAWRQAVTLATDAEVTALAAAEAWQASSEATCAAAGPAFAARLAATEARRRGPTGWR